MRIHYMRCSLEWRCDLNELRVPCRRSSSPSFVYAAPLDESHARQRLAEDLSFLRGPDTGRALVSLVVLTTALSNAPNLRDAIASFDSVALTEFHAYMKATMHMVMPMERFCRALVCKLIEENEIPVPPPALQTIPELCVQLLCSNDQLMVERRLPINWTDAAKSAFLKLWYSACPMAFWGSFITWRFIAISSELDRGCRWHRSSLRWRQQRRSLAEFRELHLIVVKSPRRHFIDLPPSDDSYAAALLRHHVLARGERVIFGSATRANLRLHDKLLME